MSEARYRTVEYHGHEWSELVEQGWVTVSVEDGRALMLHDGWRR